MLGIGRASEYAGWWNTGIQQIRFSGASNMTQTVQQSPSYSLTSGGSSKLTFIGVNADVFSGITTASGNVNLTGLTGFTGYNTYRSAVVHSFYLPWPSGLSSISGPVSLAILQLTNSTASYYGLNIQVSAGGVLGFTNSLYGIPLTLPGSYTSYTNQWLTLVSSTAETSSVFANWTGGSQGSNTFALRNALYNTQTGALIAINDAWGTSSSLPAPLGTLPTSLPMFISPASGPYPSLSVLLEDPQVANSQITHGTFWMSAGQTFDPQSATDTSWRTSSPSATIANAKAWINIQMDTSTQIGNGSPTYTYFVNDTGQSLYSQPNNYVIYAQVANAAIWSNAVSTTNIIRNN